MLDFLRYLCPVFGLLVNGIMFADGDGGGDGGSGDGGSGDGGSGDGGSGDGGGTKTATKRIGDVDFKVPDEYKEEKWAKDLKSPDDLWKKFAHSQKLIGRKGVIRPDENAPQEEWDAFYNAQGRPENPEGYEFKNIEELQDVKRDETFDNAIKNIIHKHGVPKATAESVIHEVQKLTYEYQKPLIEKQTKMEQDFQKLTHEVLGEDKEQAIQQFKEVMRDSLGDNVAVAQKLETMDNDALLTAVVFAKNIHDKYVGENKIKNTTGGGNMTGDLRSDFRTLSEQKLRVKLDKNLPEHVKKQKIAHFNSQIQKIGAKASEQGINLFGS
jgi:hypothetical protein